MFWESHKIGTLKLGFPRLLAEVSLPGGGIGGFGCGGTRTPDSDCPRPSTISEETKDSSLRSREQVKARRGEQGQWGRQRDAKAPRRVRKESGQMAEEPRAGTVAQYRVLSPLSWVCGFCKL